MAMPQSDKYVLLFVFRVLINVKTDIKTIKEANDFMIRKLSNGHWAVLWDKQDAPKIYLSNRHEVKK